MGYQTAHYFKHGNTNDCVSYTMYVPDGSNLRSQITNVYNSLFGRWGEPAGVEGWVNVWNAPDNSGFSSVYAMVLSGASTELAGINANGRHTGLSTGGCPVRGCTDSRASNYNPNADIDNGTCSYPTPSISFSISPSSYIAPGSATLTWSVSTSTSRSINQGIGAVNSSGSETVDPNNSLTYTLNASYYGITSASRSVNLTVYQPVVAQFVSASPNPITVGQSSTLTWAVTGSANTPATINQGIGDVLFSSSKIVSPSSTTTYTLSASGLGGSDTDTITVNVNQPPQLSYNHPVNINYGDGVTFDVTYRYATGGVNGKAIYSRINPATGSTFTTEEELSLPGTDSDESGAAVTSPITLNIPWTSYGVFGIALSLTATGGGGSNNVEKTINVNIDQLPDSINIPDNRNEIPSDNVEAPDFETVLSDPIVVDDIDVAVEIRASDPIQVRFDDTDPAIESNWKNVRPI